MTSIVLTKKSFLLGMLICTLGLSTPSHGHESSTKLSPQLTPKDIQNQYFDGLKALCGARFEGEMSFPIEGQDSFAGKLLVAQFNECNEDQLRIPFLVGEDSSRTWVFSRTEEGLQLKHDHRHEDGTPHEVNMYGGMAKDVGTSLSQSFAADSHTAELIPAASSNVWTVSLDPSGEKLTYHLERHSAPRFTAVLTRSNAAISD